MAKIGSIDSGNKSDLSMADFIKWLATTPWEEQFNWAKAHGIKPSDINYNTWKSVMDTQALPTSLFKQPTTQPVLQTTGITPATTTAPVPPTTPPVTPVTTSEIPAALQGLPGIKRYGKYWASDDIVNGKLVRTIFDDTGEIIETQDMGNYVGGAQTGAVSDLDRMNFDREQFEWQKAEADRARQEQAAYRAQQDALEREKLLSSLSGPRSWIQYWQAKYGTLPNTPQFIANYTGQQAGSQIRATDVATPSGQWLNRAAPSVREGLMGFADWSASQNKSMTGEDLLNSTKQQLPTDSPYSGRWLPMRK